MIEFRYPEFLLMAVPLGFAFYRWGRVRGVTGGLRAAVLVVLLVALTVPLLNVGGRGIDVIVIADRSRSMPSEAHANVLELIRNLGTQHGNGDRVGIVTFGIEAAIEQDLSHQGRLDAYTRDVLPDGSDLNDAIESALTLVNPDRPARILILSDGEANGADPAIAARKAREGRVPIDFRVFERLRAGDVAVDALLLPESVSPREPFQFPVWLHADRATSGRLTLKRDSEVLSRLEVDLEVGANQILFRDVIPNGGFYNYTVELEVAGDPLTENNIGAGIVRVDAGPRLLVLNEDGQDDNLVRALRAGNLPIDVAAAKTHPLTQDALDPYRGVIVENIPAGDFGRLKMERLAQYVRDLGGGLMLTGGERSFGTGGYFMSPLDPVLPVSMEMREEHRKNNVAIAIALDRSGSMSIPVKGNKTKMDLANLGTMECINLLSNGDSVAVIAVDSSPHVVQSMTRLDDKEAVNARVRKIESMGGGIFVYEALVAAGKELLKADQSTRHIILFSDAQDSEEPGDYKKLIADFRRVGITVSVIGLGTDRDVDAALLKDIAKLGDGNIMFTEDAEELPRLFTEDTMSVARSSFIKKDETTPDGFPGAIRSDARLMGELTPGAFPSVDGYNLSYLKTDATAAVLSLDEYQAPMSAFWYHGLGRASALCIEVDGQYSGRFGQWESYEDFLITHARWLMGGQNPDEVYVEIRRDGQDALVTIELDPDRTDAAHSEPPTLLVIPPGEEQQEPVQPDFLWTGPNSLQARFRLDRTGSFRTVVKTGDRKLTRGPAVTLPYSPEFAPRAGLASGYEVLRELAATSGGIERTNVLEIFNDPPRAARRVSLLPYLFATGIGLLLLEIAGRRLSLWERLKPVEADPVGTEAFTREKAKTSWWPKWKLGFPGGKKKRGDVTPLEPSPTAPATATAATPAPQPEKKKTDVFAAAKERARKRH